tara:strand:- start:24207 stop:25280 length:1074 start_codon:yes stop_codon:yes gene_type:complete
MTHQIIEEDIKTIGESLKQYAPQLSGTTLLLTGGAGFLGKYIVGTLNYLNANVLQKPCKVIILDNFIVGLQDALKDNEHIKVIKHDVSEVYKTEEHIDYILHAASIGSPVFYMKHPIETLDSGTLGTKHMLELAKEKHVKSLLLFSSSEVYGDPDPKFVPTPETYFGNVSCTGPRACYDEAKRVGEAYAVNYHQIHHVPAKILRPFNVFGPGMRLDDRRVVPNLVLAAMKGEKLPVYGGGNRTRTFCYVTDAITGIFQVLFSQYNGEPFNIGNDANELTMENLAKIIVELFENKVELNHIAGPNDAYDKADPERRCPDLKKIKTFVGYEPKVDNIIGLKRFITWAKDQDISNISVQI